MRSLVSVSTQETEYHTVCLPPARVGPVLDTVANTEKGDTGPHAQRAPGLLGAGPTPAQAFYFPVNIRKRRETVAGGGGEGGFWRGWGLVV